MPSKRIHCVCGVRRIAIAQCLNIIGSQKHQIFNCVNTFVCSRNSNLFTKLWLNFRCMHDACCVCYWCVMGSWVLLINCNSYIFQNWWNKFNENSWNNYGVWICRQNKCEIEVWNSTFVSPVSILFWRPVSLARSSLTWKFGGNSEFYLDTILRISVGIVLQSLFVVKALPAQNHNSSEKKIFFFCSVFWTQGRPTLISVIFSAAQCTQPVLMLSVITILCTIFLFHTYPAIPYLLNTEWRKWTI